MPGEYNIKGEKSKKIQNLNVVDKPKDTRESIMAKNERIYGLSTTGKKIGETYWE